MGFGYFVSFSDHKYPNPTWTRYGFNNYGYFTDILVIDMYQSGPEKNRPESESKFHKYLFGPNA